MDKLSTLTGIEIGARKASSPVYQTSDGIIDTLWAMRDGSLVGADWYLAKALEGRAFVANVGTLTTPTTFNATVAAAEPDFILGVPNNVIVIPTAISIQFEDTGTAQVLDVVAMVSNAKDIVNTSTAITVYNKRTDAKVPSVCTAQAVITGSGTDPYSGNFYEFWRPFAGFGEDAFNGSTGWVNSGIHGVRWSIKDSPCPPIIVDSGSLCIYAAAQAGTGFITVEWIELPKSAVA